MVQIKPRVSPLDVRKPWDIYTARLQLVPPTEDHPVLRGRAGFFAARHDARRLVPGPYPSGEQPNAIQVKKESESQESQGQAAIAMMGGGRDS